VSAHADPTTGHQRHGEGAVGLSSAPSTIDHVTVTFDLPAEALARLQAEATRRGITLDQLIAEIADSFPAEGETPRRKLAFVGMGASNAGITHQIDELLTDGFGRD
jgi:hypothetical protein